MIQRLPQTYQTIKEMHLFGDGAGRRFPLTRLLQQPAKAENGILDPSNLEAVVHIGRYRRHDRQAEVFLQLGQHLQCPEAAAGDENGVHVGAAPVEFHHIAVHLPGGHPESSKQVMQPSANLSPI